jgi:integrase
MTVTLRQRKKGNKISFYLDYYSKGKRYSEFLKLYLFPEPEKGKLTPAQRQSNKTNLELAESIRAKRHLEIQSGIYGFHDRGKLNGSFLKYMEMQAEDRRDSNGNYGNWKSTIKHLKEYTGGELFFHEINKEWLSGWKTYLQKYAKARLNRRLSANSQFSYYAKVVAALKEAVRDGIIKQNPAVEVQGIKQVETQREYLTIEELIAVSKTLCDYESLKNAFLFSALTGLRWSDIENLKWSNIEYSRESGYYLRYRQIKTSVAETLPISEEARNLLGDKRSADDPVFVGLKYSAWTNTKLREWMLKAGIAKRITFHSARHTYATLQLTAGTDIYTVSKLLGHKNLKNTQIYAKIVDQKKREAADRINLGLNFKQ